MIIDAHTHMGPISMLGRRRSCITYMQEDLSNVDVLGPEIMLKSMDFFGIDKSVVFSTVAPTHDYPEANTWVAESVRKYPDRFIGYAFINPTDGPPVLDDLDRCVTKLGMRGIKLHPVQHSYQIYGGWHDELVNPIIELAAKFKLPVIIHSGAYAFAHPSNIGLLADAFPEVNIIIAHSGSSPESLGFGIMSSFEVAKRHRNVFLETSQNPTLILMKDIVDCLGAERLLFGSDAPFGVPEIELMKIKALRLREDQERLVLGGNMARILAI